MIAGQLLAIGAVLLFSGGALYYVRTQDEFWKRPDAAAGPAARSLFEPHSALKQWEKISAALFASLTLIATLLWIGLFQSALQFDLESRLPNILVITPDFWFWLLPGALMGLISAALGTDLILRRRLGANYHETTRLMNQRAGFTIGQARRFYYLAVGLTGIVVSSALLLGMNGYTVFRQDRMFVNEPFTFRPRSYAYRDIQLIRLATHVKDLDNQLTKKLSIILTFKDGRRWQSMGYIRDTDNAATEKLLEFLVSRSDASLDRRTYLEDIALAKLNAVQRLKLRGEWDFWQLTLLLAAGWLIGFCLRNRLPGNLRIQLPDWVARLLFATASGTPVNGLVLGYQSLLYLLAGYGFLQSGTRYFYRLAPQIIRLLGWQILIFGILIGLDALLFEIRRPGRPGGWAA